MRWIRTGLLTAWIVLIISLFYDPLTPVLTDPSTTWSPFRIGDAPVFVQGEPLPSEPYPLGNRIFWTMFLPLVPIALMLFGHETWRRVCPLSHVSQIPRMLGWEPRKKVLNRKAGRVERALALLPTNSWLRRNYLYFQFGFLANGVVGRLLFYNSDRLALAAAFAVILAFAFLVGLVYGGKTWCNYFCPTAVIQSIYAGPGGLFESKPHLARTPVSQSVCRAPGASSDRNVCVGCTTNCPDVDLENSYWKSIESDQRRFVYYGFFGLVFAFYTYYFAYSGSWAYYISGFWTHEKGQLSKLLNPGFYLGGVAIPIPKLVSAPLYVAICIAGSFGLFLVIERVYERVASARAAPLSKARRRHHMLTVSAFLSFNFFYLFAGRPNILLMPYWALKLVDLVIVAVSIAWLFRSLSRNTDLYRHEQLGAALRTELLRMGFRSEELLEGRSVEQLSADEVYVLAKSLPNFSVGQRRDAYKAILTDAIETGQTKFSESLRLLKDLRVQLGLSDSDHEAIAHALGVEDPSLLDSDVARSVEQRTRRENYRQFLLDLVHRGLQSGALPAQCLASPDAEGAIKPVRALFGISEEEHAAIVSDITQDEARLVERERKLLDSVRELEAARFSLSLDPQPEARLIQRAFLTRQRLLVRGIVNLAASIGDRDLGTETIRFLDAVLGTDAHSVLTEAIATASTSARDAFRKAPFVPSGPSFLDVVEASKPADVVFRAAAHDTDPLVRALGVSGLAATHPVESRGLARKILDIAEELSPLSESILIHSERGERCPTVDIMAGLLVASVFAQLDLTTLAQIAQQSRYLRFERGHLICGYGEISNEMFVLVDGETIASTERNGVRTDLGRARVGAVFGELGVITGRPRSASVEVTSLSATVISIPRQVVEDLLGRDAKAATGILKVVSGYLLDKQAGPTVERRTTTEPATAE